MSVAALKSVLLRVRDNDINYDVRQGLVYEAMSVAYALGYPAGVRYDAADGTAWPIFCIELPDVGEISWHCPSYKGKYGGYSVEEKYARIDMYCSDM